MPKRTRNLSTFPQARSKTAHRLIRSYNAECVKMNVADLKRSLIMFDIGIRFEWLKRMRVKASVGKESHIDIERVTYRSGFYSSEAEDSTVGKEDDQHRRIFLVWRHPVMAMINEISSHCLSNKKRQCDVINNGKEGLEAIAWNFFYRSNKAPRISSFGGLFKEALHLV